MENQISEAVRSLPPGFGFDPTDEHLLVQYLKPKILEQPGEPYYEIIPEIDACELEPEKWPTMLHDKFNSKDLFFFCRLNHRYSKGERYERTTSRGYWKVTSKDRPIMSKGTNAKIGIKKTLVFHKGKRPNTERSNWVCYEYHLNHNKDEMPRYVVCRIKEKEEKKLITAHAPTISPEGRSSRPHASTSNVSGTPVNQEGDHSSFRNTLNNEVAGNQEAVTAQPETSAEEFVDMLYQLQPLCEISGYNDTLTGQPHAEEEYGSASFFNVPDDNGWLSFDLPNDSILGWESGTMS